MLQLEGKLISDLSEQSGQSASLPRECRSALDMYIKRLRTHCFNTLKDFMPPCYEEMEQRCVLSCRAMRCGRMRVGLLLKPLEMIPECAHPPWMYLAALGRSLEGTKGLERVLDDLRAN